MSGRRRKILAFWSAAALPALLAACAGHEASSRPMAMAAVPVAAATTMAASVEPQRLDLPDGLVLVGMDPHRLGDLFGHPEMVMSAGQAHWWRYAMGGCSIEMFLMPGASGDLLVGHVAVRPLPDLPVQRAEACRKLDARLAPAAEVSLDLPAVQIP